MLHKEVKIKPTFYFHRVHIEMLLSAEKYDLQFC